MFPRRRTITPVLTLLNANAAPFDSAFEVRSSPIKTLLEEDDQISDDDTLSSSGSVKIGRLSTLDLPPLDTGSSRMYSSPEWSPTGPASKPDCDRRLPSPEPPKTPTASNAISVYQLPQTAITESRLRLMKQNQDNDLEYGNLREMNAKGEPGVICLPDLSHCEAHVAENKDQATTSVDSSCTQGVGHVQDTPYAIELWESSVKLCSNLVQLADGKIQLNHFARMTVTVAETCMTADRVKLSIIVSNGIRTKHDRHLGAGQYSLFFEEDMSAPDTSSSKDGEIIVVRDTCDLKLPIDLYLSLTYRLPDQRFMVASLPTFRPRQGRTLSETIAITHPSPPLAMKPLSRGQFSTWKEMARYFSAHATSFERINMPRLYPEAFRDDIRIKIWTRTPVFFSCLDNLQPCDVVWDFDITIEETVQGTFECDMNFRLQVGEADRLVSIDPHGWTPKYFVIGGRLATEQEGEWRENDQGLLTLFKSNGMLAGPIHVATHWQEPKNVTPLCGIDTADLPLPRVTDLKIVGGELNCRLDKSREIERQFICKC